MNRITTSKKFAINLYDVLKAAATAGLTAGIAIVGQTLEAWTESPSFSFKDISLALALKAAFGAFAGYLIKNFLSPSKVIIKKEENIVE